MSPKDPTRNVDKEYKPFKIQLIETHDYVLDLPLDMRINNGYNIEKPVLCKGNLDPFATHVPSSPQTPRPANSSTQDILIPFPSLCTPSVPHFPSTLKKREKKKTSLMTKSFLQAWDDVGNTLGNGMVVKI